MMSSAKHALLIFDIAKFEKPDHVRSLLISPLHKWGEKLKRTAWAVYLISFSAPHIVGVWSDHNWTSFTKEVHDEDMKTVRISCLFRTHVAALYNIKDV